MTEQMALKDYFTSQLLKQNQVLVAILGICSALGVTNRLSIAITMGMSVTFVTGFSSFFVSMFRNKTPDSVRMITQLAIISLFVITIDQFLQAYFFSVSKVLSVYTGLIITNCIVMGRAEGMAKNVPPVAALLDGLGAGFGYAIVLFIVGFIRELFGFGEILGHRVIPLSWYATAASPDGYQNLNIMVTPPAAFFIIGTMVWAVNTFMRRK